MNSIETFNLSKKFSNKLILNDLNIQVKEQEIFGFLGKNGAGKSTFINILTGNVRKTSGSFNLLNYSDKNIEKAKKEIGVMPDVSNLYSDMTSIQFLKYMANIKNIPFNKKDSYQLLELVGLQVSKTMKIKNFSFGMKKKISLAQALIGEPKLLFLDEPTSGVDPESILNIQNLILQLNKEGSTIFLTSHNLNEIEKICTSIAILKDGNIRISGSLDEIKNSYDKNLAVTIKANIPIEICRLDKFISSRLINNTQNMFIFKVNNEEEIGIIIEHIVKNNGKIFSVIQNKTSLEQIFMS